MDMQISFDSCSAHLKRFACIKLVSVCNIHMKCIRLCVYYNRRHAVVIIAEVKKIFIFHKKQCQLFTGHVMQLFFFCLQRISIKVRRYKSNSTLDDLILLQRVGVFIALKQYVNRHRMGKVVL